MLQVTLPTGTIITITVEDMSDVPFLNVWILGSVVDLHNTKGSFTYFFLLLIFTTLKVQFHIFLSSPHLHNTKGTVSHISFFSSSSEHQR